MAQFDISAALETQLQQTDISGEALETLASQLLWRAGRKDDDSPVILRMGFASSAALFAELPRLKNASDSELELAVQEGSLRVEWVGHR